MHTAERLAYSWAVASDQVVLDQYFSILQHTLVSNSIIYHPGQIFRVDETGFPLEHKQPRVLAEKDPLTVTSGNKVQITVIACVNAAGATIPPVVIFDRKILK